MGIQDKVAKALLTKNAEILDTIAKKADAGGWWTDIKDTVKHGEDVPYRTTTVAFGKDGDIQVTCQMAETAEQQTIGLQQHNGLGPYEGMIFNQPEPRNVSFHMGAVRFPIDLIYVGSDGRVSKIMRNVEPNTAGVWSHPHVKSVIETNGGFCKAHGIEIGTEVHEVTEKTAQIDLRHGIQLAMDHLTSEISNGNMLDYWPIDSQDEGSAKYVLAVCGPNNNIFKVLGPNDVTIDESQGLYAAQGGEFDVNMAASAVEHDMANSKDAQLTQFTDAGPVKHPVLTRPPILKTQPQSPQGYGQTVTPERVIKPNELTNVDGPVDDTYVPSKTVPSVPWQQAAAIKYAQERFPTYTRKDVNPKMVTPVNQTTDRFRDRDLIDVQNQNMPFDMNNYEEMQGYDQGRTEEQNDDVPAIRPGM